VSLDARRTGDALASAASELARVWRAARASERTEAFPGLLDGLVEPFLALAAEALAAGRHPALLWPAAEGTVRAIAGDARRTREEVEAEWGLLDEVLRAACRSLDADEEAREWLGRALALARAGARRLPDREGAPGILTVRVFSDPAATRRARGPSPR
jgi:hypothetical protein